MNTDMDDRDFDADFDTDADFEDSDFEDSDVEHDLDADVEHDLDADVEHDLDADADCEGNDAARFECGEDGPQFADPGGNSALRAATRSNPRNRPCPTCREPNRLTPTDVRQGYQCDACADRAERGGY